MLGADRELPIIEQENYINGNYIDVFAKVGNWYIIKTDDDLVGAVSSDYVEPVYDESERYNLSEEESKDTEETSEEVVSTEFADSGELNEDEQEFIDLINSNRQANRLI